jgi:hypothetical protein
MSNPENSYCTSLSTNIKLGSVVKYFIGQTIEIGSDNNIDKCVGLHFYSAKNGTDHFIGKISKENLNKYDLNVRFELVGVTKL